MYILKKMKNDKNELKIDFFQTIKEWPLTSYQN